MAVDWSKFKPIEQPAVDWSQFTPIDPASEMSDSERLLNRARAGTGQAIGGIQQQLGETLDSVMFAPRLMQQLVGEEAAPNVVGDAALEFAKQGEGVAREARNESAEAQQGIRPPESIGDALTDPMNTARYYGGILAESAPLMLGAMATRNPTLGAGLMGAGTSGQAYSQAREEGASVLNANQTAITQGAIEAGLGALPLEKAMSVTDPFIKRAGKAAVAEAGTEALTGGGQLGMDAAILGKEIDPGEMKRSVVDSAIAGFAMGPIEAIGPNPRNPDITPAEAGARAADAMMSQAQAENAASGPIGQAALSTQPDLSARTDLSPDAEARLDEMLAPLEPVVTNTEQEARNGEGTGRAADGVGNGAAGVDVENSGDGGGLPSAESTSAGAMENAGATAAPVAQDYRPRITELRRLGESRTPEQNAEYTSLLETDRLTTKVGGEPVVGVRNMAAFADAEADGTLQPFVLLSDADNFKTINDTFGHDLGDQVIRVIGETMRDAAISEGVDTFHRSGDEFLANGQSPEVLAKVADKANQILANTTIRLTLPDGRTVETSGVQFSYGVGKNAAEAEEGLRGQKQSKLESGQRTERRKEDRRISDAVDASPAVAGAEGPTVEGQGRSDSAEGLSDETRRVERSELDASASERVGDSRRERVDDPRSSVVARSTADQTASETGAAVDQESRAGVGSVEGQELPAQVERRNSEVEAVGQRGDDRPNVGDAAAQTDVRGDVSGRSDQAAQTADEGVDDAPRSRQQVPFDQRNLSRLRAVPTERTQRLGTKLYGRADGPPIAEVERRQLPRDLLSAIEALEQATNTEVVLTKGLPANGVTLREGELFVDVESEAPILTTAAHEWLHQLRRDNPALYNRLAAEVKRQGRLEAWKKTIDARSERDGNGPLSQDMSEEELTADATGDAMTDPDFLRQLAQRKPGTFASLADSFMRYLDRVISKFSNLGSSQYLEDVQAFREVLLDVLTEVDPKTARRLESGDVMKSRRGWGQDFPDAVLGYRPGALAAHADYAAAKAGGDVAALRLARDLVSDEFVRAVRKAIPQNETPIIVPVLAVEEGGKNRIPLAAARVLANRLGLEVEEGIVQAQRVGRGGSDGMERIARQPTFKGKVRSGQTYIILDDTLTQGGTLAQLKTHIEDNGGKVLLATALSGKDYSRKLGIEPRTLDNLRERYADLEPFWRDTFGYGFEGLTESEARFLLKLKGRPTADAIRDRISAIRDETVQPVDEASDRVGAVSDSVVEQEQFAAGERDSDPGDPVFSRKSVNDVAATAKTARAIFTDLNKQLRNNIRNAERMRELGKEANELIGLVSTSPDYDQMLRDLSKDLTPEKRAILSGDKGPAGDRIRDALAEYDRIREEMRLAADDRRKVRLMAAEANRALDKLQRMEDKMSLADREQLIAQIDPIVETAMRVYERAKKIRDFRRAKQWAIIQAQKNRIETMNRLAAEGYPQGSITWSSLNDRWDGVKGYLRKLRKQFQDRMNSVRYTQEDIEASMGQPLEDFLNVYRRENLMHGRAADEIDQLYRQRIEPLKQFLRDNKIDQADFERYLIARHAKERNERIASINPQMPDGGSGLLTAEAQAILTEFQQRGLTAKLDDAARQVDRLRRWTLRHLRDGGQITDEMHNKLDGMYQFYVPLRGKKGEDEASRPSGRGTGGGIDTRGNPIQRALGRGEGNLPDNILAEMLGDAERAILQVEKARVGQTLLRLALEAPNPDVWVVEPVELEYKYSESTGEVYLGIKNDMADPETVIVKHKGKPYRVRLKDPQLAEAIKNLGVDSHAWVAENIGWINRYFSAVNTRYNPGFVPVNMLRDMTQGVIGLVAEHDLRTAATVMAHWHDAAHGLWLDARRDPGSQTHPWAVWAREFAEVGGKTGYMVFQNVEDIQARIDSDLRSFGELVKSGKPIAAIQSKLRNSSFIELIEDVNDVVENAMRLSTYATLRQKGVSKEKAAEYAKNLTVNFNRKGQAASLMNSLFLFFNAAVQGSHRVGKLLMNRKTQGIVAGMAGVQMVMAIVGMRMKGDDDDESAWEKIPEHVKQRSLVIPLSSDGDYFSLPMPYGFNFFTWMGGYLPNLGNRHWRERNTPGEMTNMAGKAMLNAFSPVPIDEGGMGLIPHVLKIPVNVAMNENDWGNKITMDQPFSKYDMPRSAFGRNDTSALFSYTSKLLNRIGGGDDFTPPKTMKWLLDRSPEDLEYIAEQLGGGLGRSFIKSATFTEKAAAGSDWSGTDIPILSALFGRVNAKSIQSELFYDHRDDIERSAARVRSAYKNAADEALRESGYPETVVNGYIEGGRTGAERAAARLQMDDPEGVSNELGEISRIAGEPAATQMIAELGLLADGITFSRRKDGRLSESSSGTPELTGEEGSIFALYKEVSKDLGDMKDQRMAIESNDKLGPLEKRQRLDAIKIAEAGAMSRLNRYWRDISDRYAARSQ